MASEQPALPAPCLGFQAPDLGDNKSLFLAPLPKPLTLPSDPLTCRGAHSEWVTHSATELELL